MGFGAKRRRIFACWNLEMLCRPHVYDRIRANWGPIAHFRELCGRRGALRMPRSASTERGRADRIRDACAGPVQPPQRHNQ